MEPECVDMCVTSPPYWGLRDYGVDGQLGLEKTPEEYIEKLVAIFREVRRVLRPWGTVWLNLGDSYIATRTGTASQSASTLGGGKANQVAASKRPDKRSPGLKPKDLYMMPVRVALALQADGWWLRSDIIWAKPNPMPESVTDRPTSSYEHIFLLAKSAKYFYDAEAVKEGAIQGDNNVRDRRSGKCNAIPGQAPQGYLLRNDYGKRNLRNVWTITTQPYPEAHYATFPEELPRRCILAGTSAKGNCAECGKPWVRVVEKKPYGKEGWGPARKDHTGDGGVQGAQSMIRDGMGAAGYVNTKTLGWQPSCTCGADTVPPIVLDPFFGSGTVGVVAEQLQRDWIGIEISREYIEKQAKKRTGLSTSEELLKDTPLFA